MPNAMRQRHKSRRARELKPGLARMALRVLGLPLVGTATLSMTVGMLPSPAQAQPLECANADVKIIGGVVFCTKTQKATTDPCERQGPKLAETVFVYFTRPSFIAESLQNNLPACSQITKFTPDALTATPGDEPKAMIIFGTAQGRRQLKEQISAIDLPRDRINLDLWAIQISSASPAKLASAMGEVQRQIDDTSDAMRETYKAFVKLAQGTEIDKQTSDVLTDLGFSGLFPAKECQRDRNACIDPRTSLSLTEMLVNVASAKNRIDNYNEVALKICNFLAGNPRLKLFNEYEGKELKSYDIKRIFNTDPPRAFRAPFQNFMRVALQQQFDPAHGDPRCGAGRISEQTPQEIRTAIEDEAFRRRLAMLNFAEDYREFRNYLGGFSNSYSPERLRRSTAVLDSLIAPIVDAIQRDIEAYFIRPTLYRIRQIVSRERDVQYAEVGRTTIAALNGLEVTATSTTTSAIDEPTPLRLNQLLNDAAKANEDVNKLQPGLSNLPLSANPSALSASSALALAAALSKEESRWRSIRSGIQLTMTPTVLLDRTAAELKVKMIIGNPAEDQTPEDNPLKPLSRISESTLNTKVVVNTMDLFALSSFNNQTTMSGRRWYVPLVGTIWEGAFGDIPILGNLFSFKRPTQNIQHQSIILANTLIIPSAMGMTASYCESSCRLPRSACETDRLGNSCTLNKPQLPYYPDQNIPRSRYTNSYR